MKALNYTQTMSTPSLGWERLRDVYYRTRELYSLSWDIDTLTLLTALAPLTHTIATYASNAHDTDSIDIYTASGELITSIQWNYHMNGRVAGLGWTHNEELVVVLNNGRVRWYYNFEGDFDEYSIGQNANVIGVRTWKLERRGIVVLLQDNRIVRLTRSGRSALVRDMKDRGEFHSWCIIESDIYVSMETEVYKVTSRDCVRCSVDGPFEIMSASSDGRLIALWSLDKGLAIVTSTFDRVIMTWNCPRPRDMMWCGSDAVALQYEETLKIVAPGGELEFFYDGYVAQGEPDSLTILTTTSIDILAKVGNATVDCFKIGSRAKAAILMDAVDKLTRHSPKANENLQIIGDGLLQAINDSLDAALEEFDPYWQKKLLKAASFGKAELEMRNGESDVAIRFVKVCDELRILNLIRDRGIGLFLTYSTFKKLGVTRVVELLVKRQKFAEAFQISKFLKLPLDAVFVSWACCKIKYSTSGDEELSQALLGRFQQLSGGKYISFARVAEVAFQEGRLNLAKVLINFESLFEKQIPLLLTMEENELALQKSIESQNIDLILETILILKSTLSYPQFFKLLNSSKPSSNVFEYFYRTNSQIIHDFYNQADRPIDLANYELSTSNFSPASVKTAITTYNTRNTAITSQLDKQSKLMNHQEELTTEFNVDFTNLSLSETILKLLTLSQQTRALQLVKEFKFPERKLGYLKLEHFVITQRFDELYQWAINEKPSIGLEPIVERCIKADEKRLALRLLQRGKLSYEQKTSLLLQLKEWKQVIEEAVKKRDGALIEHVAEVSGGAVEAEVNEARSRIGASSRFF